MCNFEKKEYSGFEEVQELERIRREYTIFNINYLFIIYLTSN